MDLAGPVDRVAHHEHPLAGVGRQRGGLARQVLDGGLLRGVEQRHLLGCVETSSRHRVAEVSSFIEGRHPPVGVLGVGGAEVDHRGSR